MTTTSEGQLQVTWLYLSDLQSCCNLNFKPSLLNPHMRLSLLPLKKQAKGLFGSGVFFKKLHQVQIYPVLLYCDNQGSIALAINQENY